VADVEHAARGLQRAGARPEVIVTSPALRCRNTASLVAQVLGLSDARLKSCDALAGGTPAPELLGEIEKAGGARVHEMMLVGHDPDLVALGSHLLAAEDRVRLRFEPAGCACFELEGLPLVRGASLLWLLTASQLAILSETLA
jgi:phosphohistidine phosphatase